MGFAIFNPAQVDDKPQYTLGQVAQHDNGDEYVYVSAGADLTPFTGAQAAARGARVTPAGTAVVGAAKNGGGGDLFCLVETEIESGKYGWAKWRGLATARANAGIAVGAPLNGAPAGEVDDATISNAGIADGGMFARAAASANNAVRVYLNRPVFDNR